MRPMQAAHNWQADQKRDPNAKDEKPKYLSAFRILLGYSKPHRWSFVAVFICTIIAIFSELIQPFLIKIAIDDNLMKGINDYKNILVIGLSFLLFSIMSLVFTYIQNNLLQRIGQSIVSVIRKQLFEHIMKLSMRYFDRTSSGSLITHVSSDTEALNQFFNGVLLSLFRDGLTLFFIMIMMFQLDAQLALYCLFLLPILGGIAIGFRSFMRNTYQMARTRLSLLISFVAENLSGMNIVQVFYQQRQQQQRFVERNNDYFKANVREVSTIVLFSRTFEIISNLSIAFITYVGGRAVLGHELEFGVLYAFITYIRMFFQPINTITMQWNVLQSASVAVTRIWSIFEIEPDVKDFEQKDNDQNKEFSSSSVRGKVDFNNISFYYKEDELVIKGIDLHIEAGQMIGVVGTTGAGKSSLINLLCRFYDVQKGNIEIDGTDIKHIPQADLHKMIGLVQQEPYLFSGSIIDNIRMFDESISREKVIEACQFVGADQVVERLEYGYDTFLSERGSGLSTGERQLISFARIIVFDPKILILDEASANLDSQSEQMIQRALQIVAHQRTTIVVAHRLSTIMHADVIIVLKDGQIVEQGSHTQLIEQDGYYKELYQNSQSKVAV